jgi:hypothetical protein
MARSESLQCRGFGDFSGRIYRRAHWAWPLSVCICLLWPQRAGVYSLSILTVGASGKYPRDQLQVFKNIQMVTHEILWSNGVALPWFDRDAVELLFEDWRNMTMFTGLTDQASGPLCLWKSCIVLVLKVLSSYRSDKKTISWFDLLLVIV